MKRARETWCCSRERVTRIIKFSPTAHSNLTIARWRDAPFAIEVSKGRGAVLGLAPSALVSRCGEGAGVPATLGEPVADLSKGGALKTLRTPRAVGSAVKKNPLRNLCGGRLHRWLALWVLGRGWGSTPWPGWPASRLILARYVPENCSSPSTDRVTMDTIMWAARSGVEPSRWWWRRVSFRDLRVKSEPDASPWAKHSKRSSNWRGQYAKHGAEKLPGSQVRSVRPQRKRSWRHCWARSCAS